MWIRNQAITFSQRVAAHTSFFRAETTVICQFHLRGITDDFSGNM